MPPSAPNITQLSEDSVMVTWSMPNISQNVQFFKVSQKTSPSFPPSNFSLHFFSISVLPAPSLPTTCLSLFFVLLSSSLFVCLLSHTFSLPPVLFSKLPPFSFLLLIHFLLRPPLPPTPSSFFLLFYLTCTSFLLSPPLSMFLLLSSSTSLLLFLSTPSPPPSASSFLFLLYAFLFYPSPTFFLPFCTFSIGPASMFSANGSGSSRLLKRYGFNPDLDPDHDLLGQNL